MSNRDSFDVDLSAISCSPDLFARLPKHFRCGAGLEPLEQGKASKNRSPSRNDDSAEGKKKNDDETRKSSCSPDGSEDCSANKPCEGWEAESKAVETCGEGWMP